MPTYISRRSSSICFSSLSRNGRISSSAPMMNTWGNSSPLAACSVDSETASCSWSLPSSMLISAMVCTIAINDFSSASALRLSQPMKSSTFFHLLSGLAWVVRVVQPGLVVDRTQQLVKQFGARIFVCAVLYPVYEVAEQHQFFVLARLHLMLDMRVESCFEQADVALSRIAAKLLQRSVAYAALRGGDGADEGRIVVRVRDQPQISGDVLDLGAVEELRAAAGGVWHTLGTEMLFERPR